MQGFSPSQDKCSQCGMYHPVLQPGERCPMLTDVVAGEEIDFNLLFTPLRTICISQIQRKNIKNHKKLFAEVTIAITKFLEAYQE